MADFFPKVLIFTSYFLCFASAATYPGDLAILRQFHDGLTNADLLKWTSSDTDPCGNRWNYIFCSGNRVTQIEVQKLGLRGNLTRNLNGLTELTHLGLQNNEFGGPLPSLAGLSSLQYAYFDYNRFDSIPDDFFVGLDSLRILALDGNSFNGSSGWMFPDGLRHSPQLMNLTCNSCNLAGQLPDYLGSMASLQVLLLSNNMLSGEIPATFSGSGLQILWLNDQRGVGMSGGIDLVASMVSLTSLWLHGNSFSGKIPTNIGDLVALKDLNLNSNKLVGLIPDSLPSMSLDSLDLNNNYFMGPMPKFKAAKVTCASNPFCLSTPGSTCAPEVMALIDFLDRVDYPARLVSSWQGNDPCAALWFGLSCDTNGKVSAINLPSKNLTGGLSPSVANLNSLLRVQLQSNHLSGAIPSNWTGLQSLTYLDLSNNNISFPLPQFSSSVKLLLNGNPLLSSNQTASPLVPGSTPSASSGGSSSTSSGGGSGSPSTTGSGNSSGSGSSTTATSNLKHSNSILLAIIASVTCLVILLCPAIPLYFYCIKKKNTNPAPSSLVVYPRDPSDPDNVVKIAVASNTQGSTSMNGSGSGSWNSSGFGGESHVVEAGNLIISVQVLRNVTKNFAPQNELGRGGFGVVYKGELVDGTKIAVKRMEAGMICNKALDEFQAEIAVLSKVRHRHLVSLLGYSIEGYERILVYEYMPQGALSRHLFHWKSLNLEPLSWKRRLNIALDVARGMEYLHGLAHQSFIHRDLKSSNILLADDYRAKVSDFGLVKLAPDGEKSIVTRLAGTFGYLAPEYAVTGKITTKADVFSFGVVLMELLTGLMALDEERPEESQYLVGYFWNIKSDREKLMAAIDPVLDRKDETFESITVIAELAGHCTAREPSQRPDMSHAVNVLSPLVEKWRPFDDETEEYSGINYSMPLNQMVKDWQEAEGEDASFMDLEDSKGSIPARPTGFADSFTSADAR